jgi:sigma-B regulation protein RsbU (phosphoserine phosphatase)
LVPYSLVIGAAAAYLLLLFAVGYYANRRKEQGKSLVANAYIYSLSITVYATTWTFFGSVGKAATTGIDFLLIYLGPSLIAFSWWFVLRKIVKIAKEHNITSIADFLSSRYGKSQWLGALVTIIAILGIMPYIALQLKAVSKSFAIITGRPDTLVLAEGFASFIHPGFITAVILSVFSIIFGARLLVSSERHEGLMAAIAVESLVKLGAFLLVGLYVCYGMFDGVTDIFHQAHTAYPELLSHLTTLGDAGETSYAGVFTMLFLSMSAVMFLPRQFHVMVIENSDEDHIRQAMWRFPAYLFLINFFVLPIALAGLLITGSTAGADYFVLSLPLIAGQKWLALITFLGGFSAAAGMVMVESVAISTMFLNHILMPVVVKLKPRNWFPFLLINLKRAGIVLVVFLGYLYQQVVGETYMLVNMGLISFAAAAQFVPSMVGALYWKRGNKYGAVTGICLGFSIWAYTLLLPSVVRSGWFNIGILEQGPFGIGFLKPTELFGLVGFDLWTHSLFWSMFFNLAGYLTCSIILTPSEQEVEQARKFVDIFTPQDSSRRFERKRLSKPITIMQFVNLMSKFIGEPQAHAAIAEYLGDREIDEKGRVSEFEMTNLKRFVEKTLAGSVGSAAAGAIVESYLSDIGSQMESFYDIFSNVRTSLAESREALYVRLKASELINRNLDLQIIIDDVLDLLQREFKFDLALLRLCADDGSLVIRAQRGLTDDSIIETILHPEINTYSGDAFLSNKPQFINDTRNITKPLSREIMDREGIKSFAHIPLSQAGEQPIGILSVFSKSIVGIFTEPFLQLLSSLAGQLAQAVKIVAEKEAKEHERQQKEKALLENMRVMRDMELARQIQLSLLPTTIPALVSGQLAAICVPAAHVGGDYYDFFQRNETELDMVIADVSGHNVGAALIMVETRSVFRVQAMKSTSTSETLHVLNRQLYDDLNRAELFISMFYAKVDCRQRVLTYSSAGHNRPFVIRHGSNAIEELDAEGLLIGIRDKVIFEEKQVHLQAGDLFIMFTDGIIEAEDPQGEQFGALRFCELLENNRFLPPGEIIEAVLQGVRHFSGSEQFTDDVSLVVLKIT